MKKTLLSILIASALCLSACSSQPAFTTTASSDVATTSSSEVTTTTSYNSADYSFTWDDNDTREFDEYVKNKYGISIGKYVITFGLDERLNRDFTKVVNERKQKEYKTVPFSKANYFFGYINPDIKYHNTFDDYAEFKSMVLDKTDVYLGAFANKTILSYLIQNSIPFGCVIPIEYYESMLKNDIYKRASTKKAVINNPALGNEGKQCTVDELAQLCGTYNKAVYLMCVDKSVKTGNPLDNIDAFAKCNENLKKYYGENSPQIGKVMSREQYKEIFGEEPLDLSYIPGAIVSK